MHVTQVFEAKAGRVTPEMQRVALDEGVSVEFIAQGLISGKIVIPHNKRRKEIRCCGIGEGLRVKVNALIGTSPDCVDVEMEMRKIEAAEAAGCDSFMDLSTGGDIDSIRKMTLEKSTVAVGTVPLYQAGIVAIEKRGSVVSMTEEDMFDVIERQAADGVDFMAVHCAMNSDVLNCLRKNSRVTDVVSRGGAFMTAWMLHNEKENPLYEQFDRLLDIFLKYDVVLSVGDAIRPGAIADSLDPAQIQGLMVQGELVRRAREAGVQVMVEGPGHVPLHHVGPTIALQKALCMDAPYYLLGTLATDVALGYDHISAAVGGAVAGSSGADFLCYVTPAEHLGLPNEEDVREGVIAMRIAAEAANLARGKKSVWDRHRAMAEARVAQDVGRQAIVALSSDRIVERMQGNNHRCNMCGSRCAVQVAAEYFGIV